MLLPALIASGHVDRAVSVAEAAHTAAPDDAGITAALAATYARAGQAARGVALLDRASADTNPQLDMLRARLLADDGKQDLAKRAYQNTLRQDPNNIRARTDLASLLSREKSYDEARAVLRAGLLQTPGNPVLLGALVGTGLREGGINQALKVAATLRTDPQNLPAAAALAGDAWQGAGDVHQAAVAFQSAYRATPNGSLAVRAANALAASGSPDQAIALLVSWTVEHPQDLAAQSMLGSLYITARRYAEADQRLSVVLAAHRSDTSTLNNLAWVKQEMGETVQAKLLAERAYFQSPVPEVADTLGWILARQGDTARALPLLARAATGADPSADYHYGWALNAAGRHEEARAALQKAVVTKADFTEKPEARRLLAEIK